MILGRSASGVLLRDALETANTVFWPDVLSDVVILPSKKNQTDSVLHRVIVLSMDGSASTLEVPATYTLLELKVEYADMSGTPSTEQAMFALYDQRDGGEKSLELSNDETVASMLRIAGQTDQLDLALFTKIIAYSKEEHVNMLNKIRKTHDETQKRELLDIILTNSTYQAPLAHTAYWAKKMEECTTDFERSEVAKMQAAQAKKMELQQERGGMNGQAFGATHTIDAAKLRPAAKSGTDFYASEVAQGDIHEDGSYWELGYLDGNDGKLEPNATGGAAFASALRPDEHGGEGFKVEEGGTVWKELDADAVKEDRMTTEQEAIQQERERNGPPSEAAIERRRKKMEARFGKK
jgi:hypothetical protein